MIEQIASWAELLPTLINLMYGLYQKEGYRDYISSNRDWEDESTLKYYNVRYVVGYQKFNLERKVKLAVRFASSDRRELLICIYLIFQRASQSTNRVQVLAN